MNIQTSRRRFNTQVRSTGFRRKSVNSHLKAVRQKTKTGFEIRSKILRGSVAFGISALFWASALAPCFGQVTFDTIALTGLPAPGTNPGISYDSLGTPTGFSYDPSQGFGFESTLMGPGAPVEGYFSVVNDEPSLVLNTGGPAPGFIAGFNIASFSTSFPGTTSFSASIAPPDGREFTALYTTDGGTPVLIAFEGAPAVGLGLGVSIADFLEFGLSQDGASGDGTITFNAPLTGSGVNATNNSALYSGDRDGVQLIARESEAAPGAGSAVTFSSLGRSRLDQQNEVFFFAELSEGSGIFSTTGGLHPIALEGTTAPGTPIGTNFQSFVQLRVNGPGHTSFVASLSGDGQGIFSNAGGLLEAVALKGDRYSVGPQTLSGFRNIALNDAGTTTFLASLSGLGVNPLNDFGLFKQVGDSFEQITQEAQQAPGIDGNVRFASFETLAINDKGEIAFLGSLVGTGVDSSNLTALFAEYGGALQLIVRQGDLFDVDDDPDTVTFRTISSIDLPVGVSGRAYTDRELVFLLGFSDGTSGIFTATPPLTGDFDSDGDVDADDIDFYSGNLDLAATGSLEQLDLNDDGMVTIADHDLHVTTLVETSNGQVGTFLGDINLDGNVNVLGDAFILVANLNSAGPFSYGLGDLNADQAVNVLGDAFRLVANLGASNAD